MIPSLEAYRWLKAPVQLCSWNAGWRSLLLRAYRDEPTTEEFTTAATLDQLIVLVTAGSCRIEKRCGTGWQTAAYSVGSLAMKPPGHEDTIRWRSHEPHSTLQLHLPSSVTSRQIAELWDRDSSTVELPKVLGTSDPVIQSALLSLQDGVLRELPDLYAATAAEYLAAHLLLRYCKLKPLTVIGREDQRLRRVERYMREHLGDPVSLSELAYVAGLSRFHLVRLFKLAYGETPLKRLTRMRIEEAKRLLMASGSSITEIALECGYENAAHFSTVFRRVEGVSPSAYRAPKLISVFGQP